MFLSWNVKCSLRQSINAVYMRSCCKYRSVDDCINPARNWIQWNRERPANIIKYLYSLCALLRSYIPWAYQEYHTLSDFVPMISGQMIIWTKGCNKKENSHKFDMTLQTNRISSQLYSWLQMQEEAKLPGSEQVQHIAKDFWTNASSKSVFYQSLVYRMWKRFFYLQSPQKTLQISQWWLSHGHQLDNLFIRLQRFFGQSWHMISQSWRRSPFKEL